jgi:hypothetical protein
MIGAIRACAARRRRSLGRFHTYARAGTAAHRVRRMRVGFVIANAFQRFARAAGRMRPNGNRCESRAHAPERELLASPVHGVRPVRGCREHFHGHGMASNLRHCERRIFQGTQSDSRPSDGGLMSLHAVSLISMYGTNDRLLSAPALAHTLRFPSNCDRPTASRQECNGPSVVGGRRDPGETSLFHKALAPMADLVVNPQSRSRPFEMLFGAFVQTMVPLAAVLHSVRGQSRRRNVFGARPNGGLRGRRAGPECRPVAHRDDRSSAVLYGSRERIAHATSQRVSCPTSAVI